MNKDKIRNEKIINELKKTNLVYERFSGYDGSLINKRKLKKEGILSNFSSLFNSNKMIGCAYSHIMLYKYIESLDIDYALILEDDILVLNPELNYTEEITNIILKYNFLNPNWQIIRLHSMGFDLGSAAAYIVSKKNIHELSNIKLYYHIDNQQSFQCNIVHLNSLFSTRDHEIYYNNPILNICIQNQKLGFYLNQHCFHIYNKTICAYHICYFILLTIFYVTIRKARLSYSISNTFTKLYINFVRMTMLKFT